MIFNIKRNDTSADPYQLKLVVKNLVLPILVWMGMLWAFWNVKHIPYDFTPKDEVVVRYLAKVIFTILLPLVLIHILYKKKAISGSTFQKRLIHSNSH